MAARAPRATRCIRSGVAVVTCLALDGPGVIASCDARADRVASPPRDFGLAPPSRGPLHPSAHPNTACPERRRCALVLRVPGGTRTSDLCGRERAGHVFLRHKPRRGQIMPKTISIPATTMVAPLAARPAPALPETGFLRQPQVLAF